MELSSSAKLNIHLSLPKQSEMLALLPFSRQETLLRSRILRQVFPQGSNSLAVWDCSARFHFARNDINNFA